MEGTLKFVEDTKPQGSSRTCKGGTAIQRDWDSRVGPCAIWAGGTGSPALGWQTLAAMLAGLGTRSGGKVLGADGQQAEQGPGLCPGSSEVPGWCEQGTGRGARGRQGDPRCSAPIRPHPGYWLPFGAPSRRHVGKVEGLRGGQQGGGGAKALPCEEVLAALWQVTFFVFGLLSLAILFGLACLLFLKGHAHPTKRVNDGAVQPLPLL